MRGRQVTLYLDGQEWGSFTDDKPAEPFRQVVTKDAKTGDLIVKVVNAQSSAARTAIDLGGAKVASKAKVTTLAAAPDAVEQRDGHVGRTGPVHLQRRCRQVQLTPSRRTRSPS
ncbi:hypothetical protein ACRAWF_24355 [Streptomyces sp. L7]